MKPKDRLISTIYCKFCMANQVGVKFRLSKTYFRCRFCGNKWGEADKTKDE